MKNQISISVKSFVTAILVILALMIACYVLTFLIPGGVYERTMDAEGHWLIGKDAAFTYTEGGIPFWKWLLSPVLVLGASGSGTLIAVIIFLLVIGGVFNCLQGCGLMQYMLDSVTAAYGQSRRKLLAVIPLFFMLMGAMIGSFEEVIPLVPIVVALSLSLGWDPLTGLGMSLLAVGCGFASGVCNPFTVGVAQELAGLPMFSGIWLRAVSFVLIYGLLYTFLLLHVRRIEKPLAEETERRFEKNEAQQKGMKSFLLIIGSGIVIVLLSGVIRALQDYTMIIVALMFLLAGIISPRLSGMKGKEWYRTFIKGVGAIFPAVLLILMASSIRFTLEEAKVLDTILHAAVGAASGLPRSVVILFIYLIVLVMNFFIGSGSAKAFMLIPLIVPMAGMFGISAQLCILAFAFGDGFSNVIYPTNPGLLISLGLAEADYGKWFRYSWKFQAANLVLTSLLLLLGLAVGY